MSAIPPPLLKLLRHWGPRWHQDIAAGRDAMVQSYAPLLAESAQPGLRVRHNLAYGNDVRQLLDVYAPPQARDLPVMIFVHGGAFIRGNKEQAGGLYANVPMEFARNGYVALNVEYRLAPQAPWPEAGNDVRDAVLWAARHIQSYGGDARRLFLFGHSAACAHCATAAWDERVRPPLGLPLAGLVLASPRVRADLRPENPNAAGVKAYYGTDPTNHESRAPLHHARHDAPPTLVALAQYENPLIDFYALELAHRLAQLCDQQGGPMPRVIQYPDHNHMSLVGQFSTSHSQFGADIRDWCERVERGEFAPRRAYP